MIPLSILNPVTEAAPEYQEDYKDQNNDTDEAEPTPAIMAAAVAMVSSAKATEKQNQHNDNQ